MVVVWGQLLKGIGSLNGDRNCFHEWRNPDGWLNLHVFFSTEKKVVKLAIQVVQTFQLNLCFIWKQVANSLQVRWKIYINGNVKWIQYNEKRLLKVKTWQDLLLEFLLYLLPRHPLSTNYIWPMYWAVLLTFYDWFKLTILNSKNEFHPLLNYLVFSSMRTTWLHWNQFNY